jgi:hypothetical protein
VRILDRGGQLRYRSAKRFAGWFPIRLAWDGRELPWVRSGDTGTIVVAQAPDSGLSLLHASGHATVADLQRLARAIDARRVVPVHTAHPELFPSLFQRVDPAADGQWWSV